ncbi:hypothetical protein EDD36DRAFT_469351 [Exophiala viscosa]|uniref:Zn(2)-C6 fungal-type domain-containing protein n=1 Tax=Exophiala viscosa TaxID=2486360 RepID=A0AAN6I8W1_9EURO|nr:hypothetical protein EDD36DRAFT_469351 [Exophiala viscosa]
MSRESFKFPAGRVKSCTGCRQVKLACDARKTAPDPCSRCKLKDLDCRFDTKFRRVATRRLAEEISNEVHALRSKERTATAAVGDTFDVRLDADTLAKLQSNTSTKASPEQWPVLPPELGRLNSWPDRTACNEATSLAFGNIDVNPATVIEAFEHFEKHYFPYTPFLRTMPLPSDLAATSPLLFWTILCVASRSYGGSSAVVDQIHQAHGNQLSQLLHIAIQRVETLHALLILCLWPIQQERQMYDPSWNYIGLATNAAMQLNCHRPINSDNAATHWKGFSDTVGSDITPEGQALTWLGCFWLECEVANFQGFLPPVAASVLAESVDDAVSAVQLIMPGWWRALIAILKISAKSTVTLNGCVELSSHFSLTKMFDAQLDEVREKHAMDWTPQVGIEWCNAKLNLYALTWAASRSNVSNEDSERGMHRQILLHKGLKVATDLVAEASKLGQQHYSQHFFPGGLLTFIPKHLFAALFNAAAYLFRFLATRKSSSTVEENLAMSSIIEAHKIFQSFPGHRDTTRAAIHIEMLVEVLRDRSLASTMDELIIPNRLGASLWMDAVFRSSQHQNRDSTTGAPLPVQAWRNFNDMYPERLPAVSPQSSGDINGVSTGSTNPDEMQYDLSLQSLGMAAEGLPSWWEDWNNYMEYFEVGVDEWST